MRALGIDVGGTFTDAVLVSDGEIRIAKVPTAARQETSVVEAAAAVGAEDVERFTHGTTIATNALLERRGARTALVTNEGFEHVLHLRRQTRAHLYRPCVEHPPPLVPLERCVGVRGRTGPGGELVPLDLDTLPEFDAEAIAVSLLFSFRDSEPERRVAEELRRRYPSAHVVASHEVAPEFREYERASTTAVDAYLGPVLARYLGALAERAAAARLPAPLVMRSSGGLATLEEAAAHAAFALLSGPGRRRRGRSEARRARGLRERALVRHGRHVDGRLRDRRRRRTARARAPRRRASGPAAHARRAHGRRGRRLDRPARRGRRAARRPGERGRRSRPGLLRARRRTRDRDRRESAPRTPAVDAARRDRARPRPRPSGRWAGSTPPG